MKSASKCIVVIILITLLAGCDRNYEDDSSEYSSIANGSIVQGDINVESVKSSDASLAVEQRTHEIDTRPFLSQRAYEFGLDGDFEALEYGYVTLDGMEIPSMTGGIIPHHSVANVLIADFYRKVSEIHMQDPYELVVVISPNHFGIGGGIQVVVDDYYTYDGQLRTDHQIAEALAHDKGVDKAQTDMISNEHGQLVHMPYIKHYLPDIEVISVAITEVGDDESVYRFADLLHEEIKDKKVLYIASIDFSHYLTLSQANEHDTYIQGLIMDNDTSTMFHLTDDYIDSPCTYLLFIKLLEKAGNVVPKITNHSNSALIFGDETIAETTSYFQVIYE